MTIKFDVYAIKLTEENVPSIVEMTAPLGWTLDHLQDNMEFNAEDGFDTVLFMKLFPDNNEIATFNEVPELYSDRNYRITDIPDPIFGTFHKIEQI